MSAGAADSDHERSAADDLRTQLAATVRSLHGKVEQPRFEAELLWAEALGVARAQLCTIDERPPPAAVAAQVWAWVERRAAGEPMAYLLGRRGFWTLDLAVAADVLIPRPETEGLVAWTLEVLPPRGRVADLGTGSGAIILAVAQERADAELVATDASAAALRVAERNARALQCARLRLRHGRWFAALDGEAPFDVIVSNPPYIAADDAHLPALRYEPRQALVAGVDGLDDLRILIAGAGAWLRPGGWLCLEHGAEQGAAVRALFDAAGYTDVETRRDFSGHERLSGGRWQ